jgi:hypothetical protein
MHTLEPLAATPTPIADLDRLGDEIAELSAHLQAATARLLDLIRVFDAREGWAGSASLWTSSGRSTSCIRWLVTGGVDTPR